MLERLFGFGKEKARLVQQLQERVPRKERQVPMTSIRDLGEGAFVICGGHPPSREVSLDIRCPCPNDSESWSANLQSRLRGIVKWLGQENPRRPRRVEQRRLGDMLERLYIPDEAVCGWDSGDYREEVNRVAGIYRVKPEFYTRVIDALKARGVIKTVQLCSHSQVGKNVKHIELKFTY